MKLSSDKIEVINSLGPFNHSIWQKDDTRITQEEVLTGRAEFLVKKILEIIQSNFPIAEIKKMSIVDIGCYDGYILHQLSVLPFKKIVGIEPRKKNIAKGKNIRRILGIKEKVIFKEGTLEDLNKEKFDIVLCIGVLHHLESISGALRKLDLVCKRMLILETICLPSKYISNEFRVDIEMKDIIYKSPNICGITGQKFESAYYDGSAATSTVVSIPSIETLFMYLQNLSYKEPVVAVPPQEYNLALKRNTRPLEAVVLYALKDKRVDSTRRIIGDYESGMIDTILERDWIKPLYYEYVLGEQAQKNTPQSRIIKDFLKSPDKWIPKLPGYFKEKYVLEIVMNLRYNTKDKIAFEFGKILYSENRFDEAINVLHGIVHTINADWRSCYRSFYLLGMIYKNLNDNRKFIKYMNLCKTCNPDYPLLGGN